MLYLRLLGRWLAGLRSSWVTFWRRLTFPIRKKRLQALQYLSASFLEQKTWGDWKISPEELRALRSLKSSAGWKVYCEKLKLLGVEILEYLSQAESHQDFLRRQGALQNWDRIYSLVENLSEVNETPFEEYMKKKMEESFEDLKRDQPELAEMILAERK